MLKEEILKKARELHAKAAEALQYGRSAADERTARNLLHYAEELEREAQKLEASAEASQTDEPRGAKRWK